MNASTIFDRATAHYNTAMDAHLRAIADGKESVPPDEIGVTLFATMWYGDAPRIYRITAYRIHGQSAFNMEGWDHIRIQPAQLDAIAKHCGYVLAQPPVTGVTHKLIYRRADPDQPPSGYSAQADQWAQHNAHKQREAAILAAGGRLPVEQRIKVINVAGMTPNSPGIWYCGREWAGWKTSVMENRHHISKTMTREESVEKFADDLWDAIQAKGPMYWELRKMQRKLEAGETVTLGCWCAPKVCHCDRIRKAVLWLMTQPQPPTAQIRLPQQPAQQPHYMVASAAPTPASARKTAAMAQVVRVAEEDDIIE